MGIINMKEKKYYTAGELARLFNIPKQTMLYYDKMGILKPEFVAENGYRYYSTPQYLTLEIILFLRKMDISVPDIHKFLENRSRDNILRILDRRKEERRMSPTDWPGPAPDPFPRYLSKYTGKEPVPATEPGTPPELSWLPYVPDSYSQR